MSARVDGAARAIVVGITLLTSVGATPAAPPRSEVRATFRWFEYAGHDPVSETPLPPSSFRNPILAGFYPDPSVCRVGEDYYLVNSSFSYFPGVPIFHSRDLVHWTQIGHVLTRPSQLALDGLQVSQGIFAPALRYHAGTFYMITTLVGGGGNFFVTASHPEGPWSDPVWLHEVDGIDPSFFFDDDGKAYVVNNGPPADGHGLYQGHRAIWIQEFDLRTQRLTGPRQVLVDGGVDPSKHPIWIEGPHLFKRNGWYYLMAAEGGTSEGHSEVIFRSRAARGPYVPWDKNPILTQRTLDPARPDPVTSTGHADLVETPDGSWWAVFLGCRPYDEKALLYNTGRETFMLPVQWTDDWPVILAASERVPTVVPAPTLSGTAASPTPLNGNFTWRDEFDGPALAPVWNFLRTPHDTWLNLTETPGRLALRPRPVALTSRGEPSFIGRRQQNARFTATTSMDMPAADGFSAGLVAFQNETHYLYLGLRRHGPDAEVFLERAEGGDPGAAPRTVASKVVGAPLPDALELRIEGSGPTYAFGYATTAAEWHPLADGQDGSILSTAIAGGFVGTYLGLYARVEP